MHLTYSTLNMSISMHQSIHIIYLMVLMKVHIPLNIYLVEYIWHIVGAVLWKYLYLFHLKNDSTKTQPKIGICIDCSIST